MSVLFQCNALTKRYGHFLALDAIDLQIGRGKIVGLLGPNGSGKTTLIKLANGLLAPTSGSVEINGYKPGIESKKIVAYLPERTYLADWMTVEQQFRYFADFYENFDMAKAEDMLNRLGLNRKHKLKTMSKGTREKLQLILVMSRNADLYLLDEPIGGVDPAARDYILDTILTNYNPDATVILSTHLIHDIEQVLDEVVFLNHGKIALHMTVDDIRTEKGTSVDGLFREVFRC